MNQRSQTVAAKRRPFQWYVLGAVFAGMSLAGCAGPEYTVSQAGDAPAHREANLYPSVLMKFCPPGLATKGKC
jgi:hypothetical protein